MQGKQIEISGIHKICKPSKTSMRTLIDEIKPAVLVEYEFEFGEKWNLWNFWTTRILMQGRKTMTF